MNVLVTGGAGYIGSHTAKALHAAGHQPVVLDNLVFGHRWACKWGPLEVAELGDGEGVRALLRKHRIDAVIHFAAFAFVGESVTNPRKYFTNNVVHTQTLLDAMLDCGVTALVFSSTCATYGNPVRIPISESHPQQPVNPYGETKLIAERMMHWYAGAYGLRAAALRYFNAAGADPDGEIGEDHTPETHLIPLALDAALGVRPHIDIFGTDYPTPDGTAIRDYIHVADLASAHVRALQALTAPHAQPGFRAYNLGTGTGSSVRDVLRAVERASGRKVPVRESPRRAGDPAQLVADASRAREELGWVPQHSSLDEIARHAWAWHSRMKRT